MHICYLCNEYPPLPHGGVGSVTYTLAHAVARAGHEVSVVGIDSTARERSARWDEDVRVIQTPHTKVPQMGYLVGGRRLRNELAELHRAHPIDVLEGAETSMAFLDPGFPAARAIRMHGGHHFFSVTLGGKPKRWSAWQERKSFTRAQRLCAVSRFVADRTKELLGLSRREITVIPNGVDTDVFRPAPEREEPGKIVFFGALAEKKGVRQLISAMDRILSVAPFASLTLAGRDTVDPRTGASFGAELRRMSAHLGDRIRFAGALPRMKLSELVATASVCALPSHMEALPMAWLEAMAMGKALVASTTGPGPEVVEDSVSGMLCDPHDPDAIAVRIIRLLTDPQRRRAMGAAARQRVEKHFSLHTLLDRNLEFYESCCSRTHNCAA
ncbi:MAG: glycosyltransferase family 4 protein [Acidobacteriia bacterium]|nr:glycosyltransferase family 4 protein [Terriglobia bacterium]